MCFAEPCWNAPDQACGREGGGSLLRAVVVAAHRLVPVPQWLALHLLGLGAATNAVVVWSRFFAQALLRARTGSERPARLGWGCSTPA